MLPERSDALVDAMLGKDYRVLQPIGTGGMAVVYLVEHQTLLKRFAAKVLSSDLASSDEARARFTQEAHAASQLDHENIVTITDFGITADHRPFFVMELLRGQTLDERLTDGPMTLEEVVAVAVPVARALAHAHAEGIVHRDVKPENIFLVQRSQGRWGVKVVDFGIAKTPINPKLTNMGETLGSPLFMAPEMIRGEDDVDQRADVYSFGVLLYLMLCGRLPFFDENLLKVMQMHLSAPLPPARSINPSLSPALSTVLDRALAKHPDNRYPSMDALLIELEAALPPGSDRMLIEAQSGAARSETPFAATLAMPRTESQRGIRTSEPALRTMRVQPLPSPLDEPKLPPLRRSGPSRLAIVLGSALLTGALGIGAWKYLQHRRAVRSSAIAALPQAAPAADSSGTAAAAPAPAPAAAAAAPAASADGSAAPAPAGAAPAPAAPVADAAHARTSANSAPIADAAHARTSANSAPIADAAHAQSATIADAAHAQSGTTASPTIADAAHARPGATPAPIIDAAHARSGAVASADPAHARPGAAAAADAAHARPGSPSPETTKPRAAAPTVATSKRPVVRPKTPPRRDPQGRPGKRVAAIAPANSNAARAGSAAAPAAEIDAAAATPASEPATEREVGSAAEPGPSPAAPTQPGPPAQPGPAPSGPPKPAPTAPPAGAPLPTAPPAALPPRPAAPAGPGSLDAVPAVATLDVKGSLSPAVVRRSVERSLGSLRACYQSAARAGNATPAVDLQLRFEIDENSMATHVSTGGQSFGSLASCAANVVGQLHTQEAPDVGTAQVSVLIRFRPS